MYVIVEKIGKSKETKKGYVTLVTSGDTICKVFTDAPLTGQYLLVEGNISRKPGYVLAVFAKQVIELNPDNPLTVEDLYAKL